MEIVQWVRNYLDIIFQRASINACEVMAVFHDGTNSQIFFFHLITSERNLDTLVKVNRLSFLSGSCSAGPNLSGYNFSEGYH